MHTHAHTHTGPGQALSAAFMTELHDLARSGDLAKIRTHASGESVDLDGLDGDGMTAMMAAVMGRADKAVDLLLELGANPGIARDGVTAFQLAKKEGRPRCAAVLEAHAKIVSVSGRA